MKKKRNYTDKELLFLIGKNNISIGDVMVSKMGEYISFTRKGNFYSWQNESWELPIDEGLKKLRSWGIVKEINENCFSDEKLKQDNMVKLNNLLRKTGIKKYMTVLRKEKPYLKEIIQGDETKEKILALRILPEIGGEKEKQFLLKELKKYNKDDSFVFHIKRAIKKIEEK